MGWSVAADTVLVIHFAFVVFIVVGAVLIRWARWLIWPHLVSLVYGAAIQAIGFTCPLTPLEKSLRRAAGETVYEGGFIGNYIVPLLYPGELTISVKFVLVLAVAAANVAAYIWVFRPFHPAKQLTTSRFGRAVRSARSGRVGRQRVGRFVSGRHDRPQT